VCAIYLPQSRIDIIFSTALYKQYKIDIANRDGAFKLLYFAFFHSIVLPSARDKYIYLIPPKKVVLTYEIRRYIYIIHNYLDLSKPFVLNHPEYTPLVNRSS